jgi:hypothetical protein
MPSRNNVASPAEIAKHKSKARTYRTREGQRLNKHGLVVHLKIPYGTVLTRQYRDGWPGIGKAKLKTIDMEYSPGRFEQTFLRREAEMANQLPHVNNGQLPIAMMSTLRENALVRSCK